MTKEKQVIELRPSLLWFANEQEKVLRENDHKKKHWTEIPLGFLANHLHINEDELQQLAFVHGALQGLPKNNEMKTGALIIITEKLLKQCCDVANYAMMIADKTHLYLLP